MIKSHNNNDTPLEIIFNIYKEKPLRKKHRKKLLAFNGPVGATTPIGLN